ncbi:hypothetical protein GR198_03630 [Rhizobium leguminosarum]|uniref:hypothetical protein n=1 Tax=Rhizobium leguminosarum TaxID=384 RepID=UPI0013BF4A77|nr:hypothetical protein [Rhizobium leguminosarum]NEH54830.1 hypothetical protein [Rhizobium leguminosarum]
MHHKQAPPRRPLSQVALQIGLTEDDPRLGQLGNVLFRDLDKIADGQRRLRVRAA